MNSPRVAVINREFARVFFCTNSPRVAVINREFARKIFGSVTNAMGRHYKMRDSTRIQVVGIVEDGKYMNLTEDPQPAMFFPILQSPETNIWLVVRSPREPQELAPAIRSKLRDLDAALPAFVVTWNQDLEGALFASRVATVALGVMGLLGALLAVTGIFGMAAYSVSKRRRELGIRMALGAQRGAVLQAGLGRALKLLALGSAAGLILGVLFTSVLTAIVYQATPRDPLVLAGRGPGDVVPRPAGHVDSGATRAVAESRDAAARGVTRHGELTSTV